MALTDGIVGCWTPSFGASGYRLLDRSGRGNHGTLTNMDAGSDWVGTAQGWAVDYDGTNDYVNCGGNRILNPPAITYSAWVRPNATQANTYNQIMGWDAGNSSTIVSTLLLRSNLKLAWYVGGGPFGTYDGNGTYTLQADVWQHVVVTLNPLAAAGYLNAKLDLSVAGGTATGGTGLFWIGAQNNYLRAYRGQIGETVVWNRALMAAEVQQLYTAGNGGIGRILTGQSRRRTYSFVAAGFRPYWARQRAGLIGGGVR